MTTRLRSDHSDTDLLLVHSTLLVFLNLRERSDVDPYPASGVVPAVCRKLPVGSRAHLEHSWP